MQQRCGCCLSLAPQPLNSDLSNRRPLELLVQGVRVWNVLVTRLPVHLTDMIISSKKPDRLIFEAHEQMCQQWKNRRCSAPCASRWREYRPGAWDLQNRGRTPAGWEDPLDLYRQCIYLGVCVYVHHICMDMHTHTWDLFLYTISACCTQRKPHCYQREHARWLRQDLH